ncbi:MAG: hypothetical protein BWY77_00413 [bacterium ADurb.Bin431]|nr:MAG: hypothetical protein BWY77_00413 [bacterium ADurb.Bin431]
MIGLAELVDVSLGKVAQGREGDAGILGLGDGEIVAGVLEFAIEELVGEGRDMGVIEEGFFSQDPVADHLGGGGGQHGADIDAHVKDAEGAVALGGVLGRFIHLAHQSLEVALEEPGAEGNNRQGGDDQTETLVHGRWDCQHHIADEHHYQAYTDGLAETQHPVGDDAAQKGEEVDEEHKDAVDLAGRGGVHAIFGLQKEDEDGHHGVKTETLTHVGKKGNQQTLGVSLEHRSSFL